MQFETPKALANFSPGFERSEKPGARQESILTLKGLPRGEPLQGSTDCLLITQGCRFAPTLGSN